MKVFVVGPSIGYSRFIENCELVDDQEEAQIVLFTGGEDINPELYGKKRHPSTWFTRSRDRAEVKAFNKMRTDQLAVGICRGLQLFTALNGGILVQDCDNHAGCGRHLITNGKDTYSITSIHHQMVYPFDMDPSYYDVLYWSEGISTYYEGDGIDPELLKKYGEPEIVVYHRPGFPVCLGIQGHPEMMVSRVFGGLEQEPVVDMINSLIKDYVI